MVRKIVFPGLLSGLAILLITLGHIAIVKYAFPSVAQEYLNIAFFRSTDSPLMVLFYARPFILGIILAWIWNNTKSLFQTTSWHRGLNFSLYYWIAATIPAMTLNYSIMQFSLTMIITWIITGFLNALVAGQIFAKTNP